jgi:Ran GTPase-activating protein (RanGAP) involved in mRNA processing and transport
MNESISYLFLDWSHIGKVGSSSIANILTNHYYIITLDISKNEICDEEINKIFTAIKKQTSLINLDISSNGLTHKSLKIINEVLKTNGTIGRINLSNNQFGETAGVTFKELFKTNDTITNINLSNISLGKGLVEMSLGLKTSNTVKIINLANNNIGKYIKSLEAFSACLVDNKSFINVTLDENLIDDKGFAVLSEGIKKNYSIKTFSFKKNYLIEHKLIEVFNKELRNSFKITNLSNFNSFSYY